MLKASLAIILSREQIQLCNYSVSKKVAHEIKFGDIADMHIYTICGIVSGILILIGSLRCLKEAKTMDMVLGLSVNFKIVSLFSVTYVVGTHWNCLIVAIPMRTYNICLSNN